MHKISLNENFREIFYLINWAKPKLSVTISKLPKVNSVNLDASSCFSWSLHAIPYDISPLLLSLHSQRTKIAAPTNMMAIIVLKLMISFACVDMPEMNKELQDAWYSSIETHCSQTSCMYIVMCDLNIYFLASCWKLLNIDEIFSPDKHPLMLI